MTEPAWLALLDEESAEAAAFLRAVLPEPLHTLGVQGVRQFTAPAPPPRSTPMATVREHQLGEHAIVVREYRPVERDDMPALLFAHGGGFVVGSLDGADELCRVMAATAECTVFSVEYRLAPEHPYPAAFEDVRAAYAWLVSNALSLGVDAQRIAVAGESAGGGLAASLCLDLRARNLAQPVLQLLAYPAVDDSFGRPSWTEFADAPLLGTKDAQWFWHQYAGAGDTTPDDIAVPLRNESLAGLAPAHVITAEVDPLRDDAEAYADRLAADGVPVTKQRYPGVFHGFFPEMGFTKARQAVDDACSRLREVFSS
jgi:acetyl esterase